MHHDLEFQKLKLKLETKAAHVVVLGAGYVGLPLAVLCARAGFRVTAVDPDLERISALNRGKSYIGDVAAADLAAAVDAQRLHGTTDTAVLAAADAVVICVPTPLDAARKPDIGHIVAATREIARHQHPGMLVVLESTSYPGTTAEVLAPVLGSRFTPGQSVFIAHSPQRADPGNAVYGTRNTPRVIAGLTPACLELACALYRDVVTELVPVSSTTASEMVKLVENAFRAVNVGLANELAVMCRRLGLDAFEVIGAAATKPFGFMPFYPGPGPGGHCIPLDPAYLSWKLAELGYHARFLELADSVNRAMPAYVVERVAAALATRAKSVARARVLLYGVAYKRDVADARESPALAIWRELAAKGARVSYLDPLVPEVVSDFGVLRSVDAGTAFGEYDVVVVVTDHSALERERLVREASLVVDTRNALAGYAQNCDHVHGL
ncbi:MAG TPA: nucleotide sugar dehydrogenase [Polyangiaceae bacterium]|nr:nucleotide sugar dehydrogenase [Polyangiaceae bacterium]